MTERRGAQCSRAKVLIAGGGVAGVEAALAVRELAGARAEVELRSPRREFVYRPFAVGEPYDVAHVLSYDMQQLAERCGASFRLDSIVAVDSGERQASTHDGERVPYDYMVVATGARMLWAVPGAVTFWGVADEGGLPELVEQLRAGELRSVAFTMPSGCSWGLPLYELALLAEQELTKAGVEGVRLTVATPEDAPLQVFGQRAGEQMAKMLEERGIETLTGVHPVKVEESRLQVAPHGELEADVVVSLPRLEGQRIEGVPHDREGFVPIDEHCRAVGAERLFAAGDVTSFPVKQGGIATQQADVAAAAIAAELGAAVEAEPFDPVLRGVLWTGERPRYLYGRLSGGQGETSSFSDEPPWPEAEGKVLGRYLTPFLGVADR